jgi:hypothetical protein
MTFDPYCRLYLHTTVDLSELLARCGRLSDGSVSSCSTETPVFSLDLKENDDFDEGRFNSEKRFVFARYTAEVSGTESDIDEHVFVRAVCGLISGLRTSGVQVVASCEFEDQVVEQTGWN